MPQNEKLLLLALFVALIFRSIVASKTRSTISFGAAGLNGGTVVDFASVSPGLVSPVPRDRPLPGP